MAALLLDSFRRSEIDVPRRARRFDRLLDAHARRWVSVALTTVLLSLAAAETAWPQARSAAEPAIKAAIIFNVAKFITWPADTLPARAPLNLCVADDEPLAQALADIVRGRTIEGRSVNVSRATLDQPARGCQLLYISGADADAASRQASALRNAPVVTVSDASNFATNDGTMRLFVEGGKMRLRVNLDAVQRARVQISSQLLRLAEVVREGGRSW